MNITKYMKKIGFCFILGILFSMMVNKIDVKASQVNFSVQPVVAKYQLNKELTYFDLKADPGTKTQLKIKVTNLIDKPVTVEAIVRDATTNYNGVVEYADSQNKVLKEQPFSIVKAVKAKQNKVTIPAKGEKIVDLSVQLPEKNFDGVVAGGISVIEDDDSTSQGNSDQAVINNRYLYTIAVVFHGRQQIDEAQLKLKTVKPLQINARNVISAHFENQSAMFLNKTHVKAQVRRVGDKKVLYQSETNEMQLAPSSSFSYPIPLDPGQKLEGGTYEYNADVTSKTQVWHFKQNFTITGSDAKKLNKKDVTVDQTNYWIYWLLLILIIIVINTLILLWLNRRLKKKYQEENKPER